MKSVFKLITYMVLLVSIMIVNGEDRMVMLGEVRSYGSVILAAHDAAVVDEVQKAEGYIVFDESKGTDKFRRSLMVNLDLKSDLSPNNLAIFSGSISIVGLFFIGDDKVPHDALGSPIYPYDFVQPVTYRGRTLTVRERLLGPSVVALIETPLNVEGNPIKFKTAVYRYLDKRL